MPEWKDVTGYSHGKRGMIEPQSWDLQCGLIRIVVTRKNYAPDTWHLETSPRLMPEQELAATDIAEARLEAIENVRQWLRQALNELPPESEEPHV